jgi:hypothetical protein
MYIKGFTISPKLFPHSLINSSSMPSHTIPSALIKLFHTDGAPWNWPSWQEITGIHHGLFPTDDRRLPKGISRQDVKDLQSYFDQYRAQQSEDDKIKFASQNKGTIIPGRGKWREWVTACWRTWKINARITDILTTEGLHPISIMLNSNDVDTWPSADLYLPLAVDAVSQSLFGHEALEASGRLPMQYRHVTQHLIQRTWINLHKQNKRNKTRLVALEEAATKAFNGKSSYSLVSRSIGVYAMESLLSRIYQRLRYRKRTSLSSMNFSDLSVFLPPLSSAFPPSPIDVHF